MTEPPSADEPALPSTEPRRRPHGCLLLAGLAGVGLLVLGVVLFWLARSAVKERVFAETLAEIAAVTRGPIPEALRRRGCGMAAYIDRGGQRALIPALQSTMGEEGAWKSAFEATEGRPLVTCLRAETFTTCDDILESLRRRAPPQNTEVLLTHQSGGIAPCSGRYNREGQRTDDLSFDPSIL